MNIGTAKAIKVDLVADNLVRITKHPRCPCYELYISPGTDQFEHVCTIDAIAGPNQVVVHCVGGSYGEEVLEAASILGTIFTSVHTAIGRVLEYAIWVPVEATVTAEPLT